MQRKIFNGVAALCAIALVAALGVSAFGAFRGSAAAGSQKLESGAIAVQIKGLAFQNGSRTVTVGTTVTWTNADDVPHTVTATDTSFDSKTLNKGQTFTQKFLKLRKHDYVCTIHPFMKGTVTVVLPYGTG